MMIYLFGVLTILIIMCTHQLMLLVLNVIIPFEYNVTIITIYFIVITLFEVITIPFVNKYLSFTIGIKKTSNQSKRKPTKQ